MGNVQANQTKQMLSEFTEFVTNNTTTIVNTNKLNCTAGNVLRFNAGKGQDCDFDITGGSINLNQTASSNCKVTAEDINDIQAEIKNNISNLTQQFAEQASENTQGWLATAFSFQINQAENITQLSNLIQNNIQTDIENFCGGEILSTNNAIVNLCGTYDGTEINITQDVLATGIASCVNKNITAVFAENEVLNEVFQKTDQALASKQEGIGSFFFWLAIAGSVLAVLLIIGSIFFFVLRGSGGDDSINIEIDPTAFGRPPPYYQNYTGVETQPLTTEAFELF